MGAARVALPGLATELNAILPRDATRSRLYYAALISNFPLALKGALRNGVQFEQREATPDILERLRNAESATTCLVVVLQESVEQLRQAQIIDPIYRLTIKPHLLGMMEVSSPALLPSCPSCCSKPAAIG